MLKLEHQYINKISNRDHQHTVNLILIKRNKISVRTESVEHKFAHPNQADETY